MYYTSNSKNRIKKNATRKNKRIISGKIIETNKDGWIVAEIYGNAYERGRAHGYLLYKELELLQKLLPFIVEKTLNVTFKRYNSVCNSNIEPILKEKYPEFYDEIRGISDGAKERGVNISIDFLIAWNSCTSLDSYFNDGKHNRSREKCSAFIATGDATKHGDIVLAHNTHQDFMSARLYNLMLYVIPSEGSSFVMQTAPGLIYSSIDWFISANGIVGAETTISGINYKPKFGSPIFCRMRQVMQYANTLDECVNILLTDNAGDYACGWLFGDTRTNEIMLFEIGLRHHNVERTKNGVFYGMNSPVNTELRETETENHDYYNTNTSIGNRRKRLDYLLNDQYYGKIDMSIAKKIISDHYDYHSDKSVMNSHGICKHTDLDGKFKDPYALVGAMDGKISNTSLMRNMAFLARYGSSCGKRRFNSKKYLLEHPEKNDYRDFIVDILPQKWVMIKK
jgi:hypothetical protein